jgi:hypothetical protein
MLRCETGTGFSCRGSDQSSHADRNNSATTSTVISAAKSERNALQVKDQDAQTSKIIVARQVPSGSGSTRS